MPAALPVSSSVATMMAASSQAGIQSAFGAMLGVTVSNGNSSGVLIGASAGDLGTAGGNTSDMIAIGFFAGEDRTTAGSTQCTQVGRHAGSHGNGDQSVCVGHAAGQWACDASESINIGHLAGRDGRGSKAPTLYHTFYGVYIGYNAASAGSGGGADNVSVQTGVYIGAQAGFKTVAGVGAIVIGYNAAYNSTTCSTAIMLGYTAGYSATSASNSVMIGTEAGYSATNAANSVLIGYQAGKSLSRSSTLIIDGNGTYSTGSTGLIYGEFDNRLITFNAATTNLAPLSAGVVNIGGGATASQLRFLEPSGSGSNYTAFQAQAQAGNITYTLPAADGSSGQLLTTNGSGVLSWGTLAGAPRADWGGVTDSTGGSASGTFSACGDTSASDQSTVINNNFASVAFQLNSIRTALQALNLVL